MAKSTGLISSLILAALAQDVLFHQLEAAAKYA